MDKSKVDVRSEDEQVTAEVELSLPAEVQEPAELPAEQLPAEQPTEQPAAEAQPADAQHTPAPAPAKKRAGKHKTLKIILGTVLGILVVGLALGYGYYHDKIGRLDFNDGKLAQEGTIDENDEEVLLQEADMANATSELPEMQPVIVEPAFENPFDSNIVNILLLGTDERSKEFTDAARSDTIILCSVNLETGAIKLVSLERGMGVPVLEGKYEGEWDWITHIFRYGGADLMMRTVSECFSIDVPYYVRVNFNTFIQFVDSLGGIDITLTQAETDYLNNNIVSYNLDLCDWVTVGENHMNGFIALQYARIRKIDSDWVRVTRQRYTIQQALVKAKSLSVAELDQVLNDVLPLIRTNLTEKEITSLLLKVPLFLEKMDLEGITLPVKGTYGSMKGMGDRSLFAADFAANTEILHELIYGTDEDDAAGEGGGGDGSAGAQ